MKVVKIYVHLLNEGTTVLRLVPSLEVGDNQYLLQETEDYDPDDEEWEFLPGAVVSCKLENHEGDEILVARKLEGLNGYAREPQHESLQKPLHHREANADIQLAAPIGYHRRHE